MTTTLTAVVEEALAAHLAPRGAAAKEDRDFSRFSALTVKPLSSFAP